MLFSRQALRFRAALLVFLWRFSSPRILSIASIAELAGIIMKQGRALKNNLDGRCGLTGQPRA